MPVLPQPTTMASSILSTSPVEEELAAFGRLRIQQESKQPCQLLEPSPDLSPKLRPEMPQRASEPYASGSLQLPHLQTKPRTRSPLARGHLRSQSAYTIAAPPMARTRSMPTVGSSSSFASSPSHSPVRPSSPLRPPPNLRSSPRRSFEEIRPTPSGGPGFTEIESIAEDSELDLTQSNRDNQGSPIPTFSVAFSRSNSGRGRRRPTSPLYQQTQTVETPAASASASPSLPSSRFNEPHPFVLSAASSIPSTPTSIRSRSPSISSLETIPDSPDAEEEAVEEHHIAKLKVAAEVADAADVEAETNRKLRDIGLVVPDGASNSSVWSPQRLKEKRKRWSVCGAERRGDFMETIWED